MTTVSVGPATVGGITIAGGGGIPVSGSGGSTDLAQVVKPHTKLDLLVSRLVKRRPKDGDTNNDARAIWGEAPNFDIKDEYGVVAGGVNVVWLQGGNDASDVSHYEVPIATIDFEEIARKVHNKRVENPDDSDQYVIIEVIDEITFKGPDLRPTETLTGNAVYASGIDGSLQRIADMFSNAVGGKITEKGVPTLARPPYAFYHYTLKNDGSTVVPSS